MTRKSQDTIIGIVLIVAVFVIVGIGGCIGQHRLESNVKDPTVCTEDMDCWDCHTMGNLICGPGKG